MPAINQDFNRTIRDKVAARERTRHPRQELRLPGTVHAPWQESPVAERPAGECAHHRVIETPNGTYSDGVCKRCGEVKAFRNSSDDTFSGEMFTGGLAS